MSETGFHAGHVQPEWLDPSGGGCWSLVANNVSRQPRPLLSKATSLHVARARSRECLHAGFRMAGVLRSRGLVLLQIKW